MKKIIYKFLKLLGFTKCNMCSKIIHKYWAYIRPFADSPKDFEAGGYQAPVCKSCDYWCEEHQRG